MDIYIYLVIPYFTLSYPLQTLSSKHSLNASQQHILTHWQVYDWAKELITNFSNMNQTSGRRERWLFIGRMVWFFQEI